MRVVTLIGYRAVGKTTVARLLAEALDWDWVDADVEIEKAGGKDDCGDLRLRGGAPRFAKSRRA